MSSWNTILEDKEITTRNETHELLSHDEPTDTTYRIKVSNFLAGLGGVPHDHDDRYYTESETDTLLAGKSDIGHDHDDRYYTEAEIDALLAGLGSGGSADVGDVKMTVRTTPPLGWLLCDGSEVSRTTYAVLFSYIGESFGVGDGSTTFNLPDFRGRSPLGAGQGVGLSNRDVGDSGGEEEHQLNINEMPSHGGHRDAYSSYQHYSINPSNINARYYGGDQPHNTMHPFLSVNFIIFTGV